MLNLFFATHTPLFSRRQGKSSKNQKTAFNGPATGDK